MRRLILVMAAIGMTVLLASGAALAITYGWDDDGVCQPNEPTPCDGGIIKYRGVGALVDDDGTYCSGTLVPGSNNPALGAMNPSGDPVFVTAAHCDFPGKVYVTFESEYVAEGKNFANVGLKEYSGTLEDTGDDQWYVRGYDIAVVVFDNPDEALRSLPKAKLPTLNSLNDVQKGQKFTAVGYGVDETLANEGERRYAVSSLTSKNSYYLSLSQHQKKGYAGTCYGDSGGPNFFGADTETTSETDINAALTNTGDALCKTKNTVLRLDTQAAHDFLGQYVAGGAFVDPLP